MARPQRITFENAYYHVMNRGAGRQNIFCDEHDKATFLRTLDEACQQFKIEIHAYCLMDNHYHLLIKTPEANLSRSMRHINGVYTQRYNKKNQTDGALFRGRYKAILVDSDAYLLHLSKYIHLNPLTANMVEQLENYPYSSYLAYIDKAKTPLWLVRDEIYGQLTQSHDKALHYKQFMHNRELNKTLQLFYQNNSIAPVLGDEAFINALELKAPSKEVPHEQQVVTRPFISDIISTVAKFYHQHPDDLIAVKRGPQNISPGRKMAMLITRKYGDYRLQTIADAFGLTHYGGASYAIHTFNQVLNKSQKLQGELKDILNKLGLEI